MRKDKELAIDLRRKGKSYKQIRDELRIPLSTLSDWFSKVDWSVDLKKKLSRALIAESTVRIVELDRIRGEHLARVYAEARNEAAKELETLKYNPLFIAGIMLYWGEGSKSPKDSIKLANTDPEMISLYVQFLLKACKIPVEKIKANVLIYPDLEERTCRAYWASKSGLPWGNFTKSVLIQGRHKIRRPNWGVCTVTVSSTYFKQKILEWIKLLPKELIDRRYYENIQG